MEPEIKKHLLTHILVKNFWVKEEINGMTPEMTQIKLTNSLFSGQRFMLSPVTITSLYSIEGLCVSMPVLYF